MRAFVAVVVMLVVLVLGVVVVLLVVMVELVGWLIGCCMLVVGFCWLVG